MIALFLLCRSHTWISFCLKTEITLMLRNNPNTKPLKKSSPDAHIETLDSNTPTKVLKAEGEGGNQGTSSLNTLQ